MLSSIAIAATATLLGVGTFARFSDQASSALNKVAAGTLDVQILNGTGNDTTPEYAAFAVTDAKPGDSAHKQIHFTNVGTLPGKLYVKVVMDSNLENGIGDPEVKAGDVTGDSATAGGGELGAKMLVTIDGLGAMQHQPLTALNAAAPLLWEYNGGILAPGGGAYVAVDWSIPDGVGNDIQSDSVAFHLEFTLEQV